MSQRPAVQVRTIQGVATVQLARPERRNALDEQLQAELRRALEAAADDPDVRGVILTGQGRAFSAGGDVARMAQEQDPARFRRDSQRLTELITLPERIEKPVIAAINGVLTGAGPTSRATKAEAGWRPSSLAGVPCPAQGPNLRTPGEPSRLCERSRLAPTRVSGYACRSSGAP
jgi:hypothetical protein